MALTTEQVEQHGLPLVERVDRRDEETRRVAECEAMPQALLLGLVRDAVADLLPEALEEVRVREERGQRAVKRGRESEEKLQHAG